MSPACSAEGPCDEVRRSTRRSAAGSTNHGGMPAQRAAREEGRRVPEPLTRRALLLELAAVAGTAAAGFSDAAPRRTPPTTAPSAPVPSTTAAAAPPTVARWPLTGEPLGSPSAAARSRGGQGPGQQERASPGRAAPGRYRVRSGTALQPTALGLHGPGGREWMAVGGRRLVPSRPVGGRTWDSSSACRTAPKQPSWR